MLLKNLFTKNLFSNIVIRKTLTNTALLTDSEINQLINAAPISGLIHLNKQSQQGQAGEQISTNIGSGSDFSEVRSYYSGDDPRHIDWRATARSQIPLVRTYHQELSQPLCLVIDRRATMRFATRTRLKVTQALRLALWMGGKEARLGREISAVLLDSPCHWLPAHQGLSSLKLIARLANTPCPPSEPELKPAHKTSWNTIFSGLRQHIPQGSELVLLSDFIGLGDKENKTLRNLGKHCSTRAIQIFDPSEASSTSSQVSNPIADFPTSIQLQWGQQLHYSASSKAIKEQLSNRSEHISKRFQQANIKYMQLSVEQNELSDLSTKQYQ